MSRPAGAQSEPKDGDFVAYLESLQKCQLDELKTAAPRPASLNEMHETIKEKRGSISGFLEAIAKRSGKIGPKDGESAEEASAHSGSGFGNAQEIEANDARRSKLNSSLPVGAGIAIFLTFGGAAGVLHAFETENEHLVVFCLFAIFIGITLFAQLRKTQKRRNRG